MKILGIKTAYRLTKEKVVTTCCVTAVMGLCCVAAIAVNTLLNYSDVQALRVDPGDVIDYDVIPEEFAPDRENNGIKTPSITSDTKAGQKLNAADMNATEPEETEETTTEETTEETTETSAETEETETTETSETTTEETTTEETTSETTAKPASKKSSTSEQVPAQATRL